MLNTLTLMLKRRKMSLYREYNKKYPVVPTLQELQNCAQLQTSLEGVPWILHSDVQLNLLVLAMVNDLSLLHGSEVWVGDGNFDYQLNMFANFGTTTIEMVHAPPITRKVTTVVSLVCLTLEGSSL